MGQSTEETAMGQTDNPACIVIRALLKTARLEHLWTAEGPTSEAIDLLDAGGGQLSHGQQVMLRAAFDLWSGHGKGTLAGLVTALEGQRQCNRPTPLLSEHLKDIDTPAGRARVAAYLASEPYPHFTADPNHPGLVVKVDEDGKRTLGRFVKRVFTPVTTR